MVKSLDICVTDSAVKQTRRNLFFFLRFGKETDVGKKTVSKNQHEPPATPPSWLMWTPAYLVCPTSQFHTFQKRLIRIQAPSVSAENISRKKNSN